MKFSRNPVITGCSENTVVARLKATAAGMQDQCSLVHCSSYSSLALVARPPTLCLQVLAAAAHQSGQAIATLCWYRVVMHARAAHVKCSSMLSDGVVSIRQKVYVAIWGCWRAYRARLSMLFVKSGIVGQLACGIGTSF